MRFQVIIRIRIIVVELLGVTALRATGLQYKVVLLKDRGGGVTGEQGNTTPESSGPTGGQGNTTPGSSGPTGGQGNTTPESSQATQSSSRFRQDSSDVTSDTDPLDFYDPTG